MVYNPQEGEFEPKLGPIFNNLILADEINRAPAKVQSALLEAMQERQVTLGDHSYKLPEPFLVLATQNPIDQEGTYQLPKPSSTASCSRSPSATRPKTRNSNPRPHGHLDPALPDQNVATPEQVAESRSW
jgi:MoxR-like ATPase